MQNSHWHPFSESLLLMAMLDLLVLHWQVQHIMKDGPWPTFFGLWWKWAKMFFKDSIPFLFRYLQGAKGGLQFGFALVSWFIGVFFQLPALNYLAQLLLATILGEKSSAWLIVIQLVCWQTEFYAIINALSGLWTSFNCINDKCTFKAFAFCQKDLCCSGIGEELGEMSCKTRSQNILKAHLYAVFKAPAFLITVSFVYSCCNLVLKVNLGL